MHPPGKGFQKVAKIVARSSAKSAEGLQSVGRLLRVAIFVTDIAFWAPFGGNSPESGETPMPNRDFSSYLDRLASRCTWGGALELTALAEYLDVFILVLGPHHPPELHNIDAAFRMLALWFQDDHYECLNGPLPEDLVHVAAEGSS